MLSPSSGAEVTRQGSRRVFIGPEHQELRAGSQSEGGNMGIGCRPLGSLQEGYREGHIQHPLPVQEGVHWTDWTFS
jgi:hypothetical protein